METDYFERVPFDDIGSYRTYEEWKHIIQFNQSPN